MTGPREERRSPVLTTPGPDNPPPPSSQAGSMVTDPAADLLHMIGEHAQHSIAELDYLERTYRARLDALPDAPELAELRQDIDLVRGVADDVGWIRTVAAQTMFEIAVERERGKAIEKRLERLERWAGQSAQLDHIPGRPPLRVKGGSRG